MADTKTGEEVKEPEAKTPEAPEAKEQKTLSPQEENDALRQKLTEAEAKAATATKWEEEAKAHQKVVSKKDQELQETKKLVSSIEEIKARLDLTDSMFAQFADKGSEGGHSFAQIVEANKQQMLTRKGNETIAEIDELLKGTGLDRNSPELENARLYFERGSLSGNASDYNQALKKAKDAVSKVKPEDGSKEDKKVDDKKETEDERIERLADEKFKAKMIEKGLLTAEGAEPSAGTTDATWYKDQWCTGEAPATPANLERAQKFMDKGE